MDWDLEGGTGPPPLSDPFFTPMDLKHGMACLEDERDLLSAAFPDEDFFFDTPLDPPSPRRPLPEQEFLLLESGMSSSSLVPPLPSSFGDYFEQSDILLPENQRQPSERTRSSGKETILAVRLPSTPSMLLSPQENNVCGELLRAMARRTECSLRVCLRLLQEQEAEALALEERPLEERPLEGDGDHMGERTDHAQRTDPLEEIYRKSLYLATCQGVASLREGVSRLEAFLDQVHSLLPPAPALVAPPEDRLLPPSPYLSPSFRWILVLFLRRPCRSLVILLLQAVLRMVVRGRIHSAAGLTPSQVAQPIQKLCSSLSRVISFKLLEAWRDPELTQALDLHMVSVHHLPSFETLLGKK